ncbi:MAG TPA: ATP-dependent metallopeptidase FtsH/Yme1/Tma family protein, partial [Blastocatellia bacterium]|nr:ATP-dependent metallopeptidase FtsH/Yme1/Tma family protein [Blastocatellia bacterium]
MIIVGGLSLYLIFHSMRSSQDRELSYSELLNRVDQKEVATAVIEEEQISGLLTDQRPYRTKFYGELIARDLADRMRKQGINVSLNPASARSLWG